MAKKPKIKAPVLTLQQLHLVGRVIDSVGDLTDLENALTRDEDSAADELYGALDTYLTQELGDDWRDKAPL